MPMITGHFETPNASKYLQQLCKHFAHKITVDYTPTEGRAELPVGPAVLTADTSKLMVQITLKDACGAERAKHIVDSHLERFAFREDFKAMDWTIT